MCSLFYNCLIYSPVEYISVQTCVHSFPRSSSTEAATTPHHHVEYTVSDKVFVLVPHRLQANHKVSKFWQWVGTYGDIREICFFLQNNTKIMI